MFRKFFIILACIICSAGLAGAQDISIDSSGNLTTGSTNSNGNMEVTGASGQDSIVGSTSGTGAAGVYGGNTSSGNYGILGDDNYGVYGNSSSGYAGYFNGNARITGNLTVNGTLSGENDPSVNSLGKASLSSSSNQIPKWNGSAWVCSSDTDTQLSEAQVDSYVSNNGYISSENDPSVNSLGKASLSCSSNQIPKWNGSAWACAADNGGASYANYAVVALSGGDYTSPVTAMSNISSWCGTPSASNPCLLKILPGVYSIGTGSVIMKSYVDIEGSGRNVTTITGSILNSSSGVIVGASNAEIRDLTVENTSSVWSTAIYLNNASPDISNASVIGSTTTANSFSIQTANASSPVLNNVYVSGKYCALCNWGTGTIEVKNSELEGVSGGAAIDSFSAITNVAFTKLTGTVASTTCAAVYDAAYTFYASTCP